MPLSWLLYNIYYSHLENTPACLKSSYSEGKIPFPMLQMTVGEVGRGEAHVLASSARTRTCMNIIIGGFFYLFF